MKAYSIRFRISTWKADMTDVVDAKDRDSAVRKIVRKYSKRFRVSPEDFTIKAVSVIGYF